MGTNFQIREIRENEYSVLSDFLYEAIFIPEGDDTPFCESKTCYRGETGTLDQYCGFHPRFCQYAHTVGNR